MILILSMYFVYLGELHKALDALHPVLVAIPVVPSQVLTYLARVFILTALHVIDQVRGLR